MAAEDLPGILGEVAAVAGRDAALRLARERGGQRLNVPQHPTPRLVAEVGEPAAAALCRLYARERVEIPFGPDAGILVAARRCADAAIAEGSPTSLVARRAGMTERSIRYRKAKLRLRANSDQLRLFDE